MEIAKIIALSELLGEMGHIKRATRLPNGEAESDSHHSFSLALIAYHIVVTRCPELDAPKVLLFALAHDLLEILTGDDDTLHLTQQQLVAKHQREKQAAIEFKTIFADYPELQQALYDYEKLDTAEAATVFVLDKACTTWTHHADNGKHAREQRNLTSEKDIMKWADRQREKIHNRLHAQPPQAIFDLFEDSCAALQNLYQ
ncbi:MAG TPA: HD domain-containing protein [Candidatus Saccharibacteria bacterium]|jgi:5'-deoxynucleotidase YfbR-like HD superfamily hydrolase|nr:HD domain-containing protein [Candidatus Saccharibacteria bacterium]HMR38004.1 HD domain-containing protein [Candidatus Saccharibacteria bacterium]